MLFRIGNQMLENTKLANDALGPTLFTEIGLALLSLAINVYFVCTIYSLFFQPFYPVVLIFILASIAGIIASSIRLGNLVSASESLITVFSRAKDQVQDFKVIHQSFWPCDNQSWLSLCQLRSISQTIGGNKGTGSLSLA